MGFEELIKQMISILDSKKKLVRAALAEHPDIFELSSANSGKGISSSKNDMRLYRWIAVKHKPTGRTFWVTFFQNNFDKTTGNFHTDFGRICFIEPTEVDKDKPFNDAKLNIRLGKGAVTFDENRWQYPHRYTDKISLTNGKWMTADDICEENASVLVEAFIAYINEWSGKS